MSFEDFFALVSELRRAQTMYFKEKSQMNLRNALRLEREVDKALATIAAIGMQIPMFGGKP